MDIVPHIPFDVSLTIPEQAQSPHHPLHVSLDVGPSPVDLVISGSTLALSLLIVEHHTVFGENPKPKFPMKTLVHSEFKCSYFMTSFIISASLNWSGEELAEDD